MDLHAVRIDKPEDMNFILGHSHFIKTVEDLHETLVQSSPTLKFGLAFNEASGPRLVRCGIWCSDSLSNSMVNAISSRDSNVGRGRSSAVTAPRYVVRPAPIRVGTAMTYAADPRIDAYIGALPDWQQAICREVRDLVHGADAEVAETIKRTRQPYFVLQGNICALLAAKDHVNVFLYDGGIVPDPDGIVTGGHDNKTARTMAIRQGETINAPALSAMFRQIIANNRAGGWRKLKRES